MFPYPYIMLQLAHERQHRQEQGYYQHEIWKAPRINIWQHLIGHLNAFFSSLSRSKRQCNSSIPMEVTDAEKEKLSQNGFTDEEVAALLRLRERNRKSGKIKL